MMTARERMELVEANLATALEALRVASRSVPESEYVLVARLMRIGADVVEAIAEPRRWLQADNSARARVIARGDDR